MKEWKKLTEKEKCKFLLNEIKISEEVEKKSPIANMANKKDIVTKIDFFYSEIGKIVSKTNNFYTQDLIISIVKNKLSDILSELKDGNDFFIKTSHLVIIAENIIKMEHKKRRSNMTDYGDRCACGECEECLKQEKQMKAYIGVKIVKAVKMDRDDFMDLTGQKNPNEENAEGYMVIYPDGYKSWSPKEVFEDAYRLISDSEKLITKNH